MNLDSSAFTPEVIAAWREVMRRHLNKIPAEPKGKPNSIADLTQRLRSIREGLKIAGTIILQRVPAYQNLQVNLSNFFGMGNKGARLKGSIWVYVAPGPEKTIGRLQMALTPWEQVFSEYVVYKKDDPDLHYHVEDLSGWFREPHFFTRVREELLHLPGGYSLLACCGDGRLIDKKPLHALTRDDWRALAVYGLHEKNTWFSVFFPYQLEVLKDLTIRQLAEVWVADLAELYPIRQILNNGPSTPVPKPVGFPISGVVRDARERQRKLWAENLASRFSVSE